MKNVLKTNTTLSEPFQNSIGKSLKRAKSIPLTHKYATAHFLGVAQATVPG
jgi:hypothetical protein